MHAHVNFTVCLQFNWQWYWLSIVDVALIDKIVREKQFNRHHKSKARMKSSPKPSFVYKIFWLNKKKHCVFIQFRLSHTDNTACYMGFAAQITINEMSSDRIQSHTFTHSLTHTYAHQKYELDISIQKLASSTISFCIVYFGCHSIHPIVCLIRQSFYAPITSNHINLMWASGLTNKFEPWNNFQYDCIK